MRDGSACQDEEQGDMPQYLMESPHSSAECLEALNEVLAQGEDILDQYNWGCLSGHHRGWVIVEAESESAARSMLPPNARDKARVVEVNKFTRKEVESFHKKK
jgi:hypothetical protein